MVSRSIRGLLLLSCIPAGLSQLAVAQTVKRIWVLQGPDSIIQYDPITFAPQRSVSVPSEALERPDWLAVSSGGRILLDPDPRLMEYAGPGTIGSSVWLWNGRAAAVVERGWTRTETTARASRTVTEIAPRCFLSEEGQELYWFGNEFTKVVGQDFGIEYSVATTFRAWQSGPDGLTRGQMAQMPFDPCECGTGVCEETCPEAEFWVPPQGIRDFFIVTQWIPGQLGSTYLSSYLYRKSGAEWSARELPQALERVLDATRGGDVVVHAVPDAACCGWNNESADQTLLTADGRTTVLFDERARYANPNYDVSFFSGNASLSPDARLVATTIVATERAESEIRLSSEGRADAAEYGRIVSAIADLPTVEVFSIADPPRQIVRIPRATLIGWLGDTEILVLQDQTLVAVNFATGSRRMSQIRVPRESHVFLR